MKLWGMLVVFLYVLILVALSGPLAAILFFSPEKGGQDLLSHMGSIYSGYSTIEGWLGLAVALVAQAALLSVPVEIKAARPVTRRSVVPLVLATAFAAACLLAGIVLAVEEVFRSDLLGGSSRIAWSIFLVVWAVWAGIFFYLSRKAEPQGLVRRYCRWLLRGSILELLVAVPSHILVRQRNECCAGFMTGTGIACGMAVMLFAFGPGVFYLFADRIRHLRKAQ